jgi:PKD repeat protein
MFLLSFSATKSQEPLLHCGTDEMRMQLFNNHPELHSGIIGAQQRLQHFTAQYVSSGVHQRGRQLYIIPVVFHIIHNFGPENISDMQVYDALRVLNRNFRKQNPDTSEIVADFKGIAADCQIELRIARTDPYGNCTKGINRIASPLTYTGDHQVKSLIHWDPSRYLNIYVCADAAGLAGHALLPADADAIPHWDGIVIKHDYLGSMGTSDPIRSVVLSHELGHYLNLQHVWGGNNVPGFYYLPVGQPDNCNHDDDVQDTPNTIGWSTCNLNAISCGTLDNVQNFMDYAYCARMFTEGQKLRMHACLNSTVANRYNLWQLSNHTATGIDGSVTICRADFTADRTVICRGQSVTFYDQSYHDITARYWTFEGASISTSVDSSVQVTYYMPGKYDISLQAFSGSNSAVITKNDFITVLAKNEFSAPFWESFEYDSSLLADFWFVDNYYNDASFHITGMAAYSFSNALMLDNFSNTITRNTDEITSRCFDLSGFAGAGEMSLRFRYAFAFKQGTPTSDRLRVYISNDCGATWIQKANLSAASLSTATATNQPFYPVSTQEWKSFDIPGISGSMLTDGFRIKFSFEGRGGNNLFIDDINLGNANAVFSGVDHFLSVGKKVNVFPNPFDREVYFLFHQEADVFQLSITDMTGSILLTHTEKINNRLAEVKLDMLLPGIYFAHIISHKTTATIKLLKY